MTFLRDAGNRIWSFISPRKTQQRRDKEFKAKVSPLRMHDEPNTVANRVKNWNVRATHTEGSPGAVDLPPSPPTSLSAGIEDYEGDTLNADENSELYREESESWDANEETIVVDEDRYISEQKAIDRDEERRRREAQGYDLRAAGWSEDAIFLFQKLGMRGFEPLLPYGWVEDFKSLPTDLFTPNMDKAFIKPMFDEPDTTSDFRAFKALETLFQLGGRARDAVKQKASKRTPEWHVRRAIRNYEKWATKDAHLDNIWGDLSLFKVLSADKGTKSDVMEAKMRAHLRKLATEWQSAFDAREVQHEVLPKVPTLYGVIVSHTIMAFVSYDSSAPDSPLRTVAIFDFGLEGYDVWNSLAIAIFVIHARNRLVELGDFLPTTEITTGESDPDL